MLGAHEQSKVWEAPSAFDGTAQTLATAPEGLSARRVEHWLGLPPGAWQRRRLYALRLVGQAFSSLGFQPGDLVIVEPGAREQPESIVVTRSPQGLSLRRIPPTVHGERRMPTVLELPLRERTLHKGEHVVGTAIGLLRSTGTGALRPVQMKSPRATEPKRLRPLSRPAVPPPAKPANPPEIPLENLVEVKSLWHRWVTEARTSTRIHPTPGQTERWSRLDSSLLTLCECLARTHIPELRQALLGEAEALVRTIRTEMGDAVRG